MDEDGGFMLTEMRRVLEETLDEPPVLHHLLYECTALESPDRCHRALQFTKCFWEQIDQVNNPINNNEHNKRHNFFVKHPHSEDTYNAYNIEGGNDNWLHR